MASFAPMGIAWTAAFLVVVAVWAVLRRRWRFLVAHAASATAMWLLVWGYLQWREGAFGIHHWNRAFADASLVLYAVTLSIGPLARLWRPASKALEWRRETGIWATVAACVHVGMYWKWVYDWDGWRMFFYPFRREAGHGGPAFIVAETLRGDPAHGFVPTAFALGNAIGLAALVYALVLTFTSNDASQRLLKRGWSWLMQRATTMQILVLLHTWIFAYYVYAGKKVVYATLWASFWVVLLLQSAAFVKTVLAAHSRRRPPRAGTAHGASAPPGPVSPAAAGGGSPERPKERPE